jgi:hypothetical protein
LKVKLVRSMVYCWKISMENWGSFIWQAKVVKVEGCNTWQASWNESPPGKRDKMGFACPQL